MKTKTQALIRICICSGGILAVAGMASAGTYNWDPGFTPATPSGGTGTWNAANSNWSNFTSDAVWSVTAADDNKALFGATAGTITLGSALSAGGIQFDTSSYTLSGSQDLTVNPQVTGSDALVVSPGVSGITLGLRKLILTASGSGAIGDLINTDKINFGSTIVAFSGSRQMTLSNSTSAATTMITNFAIGSGTPGGASIYLNQGNLVITNFAASTSTSALAITNNTATTANMAFRGTGSGKYTISGNNTLLNNAGTGNLTINFTSGTSTFEIGHDNALGARDASNNLTDTALGFISGTMVAINGARIIANPIIQTGGFTIGGGNAFTFSGSFTNSGGNRTLTVNNTAATTLSGPVYLAGDDVTSRTLIIGGTGGTTVSGAVGNNTVNTVASNLTKSDSGTLTLSGTNTYTGNTTVNAGNLVLADTGTLKFAIQPASVSNKVTGAGATTFNGAFNINVAAAGPTIVGTTWSLVETSSTYGSTFAVAAPFAETSPGSGYWAYNDGTNTWYFSKLSGKLTYGTTPERVWDGDSGGAWSDGNNWVGGTAPVTGDTLVFAGANTTNSNDQSTETIGSVALAGIIFGPSASSFNLAGDTVNLSGKSITNYSANAQSLAFDVEADTGFTVNTSGGVVTLTGSLKTTSGFNKPLTKNGTGTLVLNGIQNTSWGVNVNAGTLQIFNPNTGGQVTAFTATVASGATLKLENGDVFHSVLGLTNNGIFDISSSGESFGSLLGGGVVTNHGASPAVTSTISLGSGNNTFSGSIQNGPLGSPTAVTLNDQNTGDLVYYTTIFSGNNSYTGNTMISQKDVSFVLTNTGSLAFEIGADGVSNLILGVDQSAGVGTVTLNGTFNINLSGASIADGNSWQLVGSGLLPTTTFGAGFNVPGFTESSNVWTKVDGTRTWTFDETSGVLSLAVAGGSGFGSWVTGFGLAVGDQDPGDDADSDGFSNLLEYVLGGNPNSSATAIAPAGSKSGSDFILSFKRSDLSESDTTLSVEYGNDLTVSGTVAVGAASSAGVAISELGIADDAVSVTIPTAGATKFFARLKAVK
ncbi:MAG: autotransporter-associated beta strand repeat-containing protein [Luteolibacter sp.]|uniref:beta strand repeat-containing protein n=1 Tax=Luteolibacter sp. TaxID=1962973 RepID=UPI003266E941